MSAIDLRLGDWREVLADVGEVDAVIVDPPYLARDFRDAVSEAERKAVEIVLAAAQAEAKHAEWYLERRFPQRWGKTERKVYVTDPRLADREGLLRELRDQVRRLEAETAEEAAQDGREDDV